jgi:outer membrane autotransporter protein
MKPNVLTERRDAHSLHFQSVSGLLLLLALLLAGSLQALAQGTIGSSYNTGVVLNDFFSPPINSVTVSPGVTIDNTSSGLVAVYGYNNTWNLTVDNATINGTTGFNGAGVRLDQGGSVNNVDGLITGGYGVVVSNKAGSVINSGSIYGYASAGVRLSAGGSVNNLNDGYIYGFNNGIKIEAGGGTVANGGSIYGSIGNGVHLDLGGTVNNTGSIQGTNGVLVSGGTGYVTNSGNILGFRGDGVRLQSGGVVVNEYDSTIDGTNSGVRIDGSAGTVINNGSIYGDRADGVYLSQGGYVENQYFGYIEGHTNGVKIVGDTGAVVNNGRIQGDTGHGIYLGQGGSVNNLVESSIWGYSNGVEVAGAPGYVTNAGSITGQYQDGVKLKAGGTVENEYYSSIWGFGTGVKITNGVGTVINGGSIIGATADGVYMNTGGSVYNFRNTNLEETVVADGIYEARIQGAQNGVFISGGAGYVYNNAEIYGGIGVVGSPSVAASPAAPIPVGDGVYLGAGGTVYNDTNGYIRGNDNGVNVNASPSTVINYGQIEGTHSGVYMGQGSTLSNVNGGTITGGDNGVYVSGGAGTVVNRGASITGQNGDGVFMNSGGTVLNQKARFWEHSTGTSTKMGSSSIYGSVYGVEISGAPGTVENSGSIYGESRDGVRLRAGGTVANLKHGDIYGNVDGVHISTNLPEPAISSTKLTTTSEGGGSYEGDFSVLNYGTIRGNYRDGVLLEGGGTVLNLASRRHHRHGGGDSDGGDVIESTVQYGYESDEPSITGGRYGVEITDGTGTVVNEGLISGEDRDGVRFRAGGTVENKRHGTISGNDDGVHISDFLLIKTEATPSYSDGGEFTVYNSGSITGTNGNGVWLENGGSVMNSRRATILGGNNGVEVDFNTGYVYNEGSIIAQPPITPDRVAQSSGDGVLLEAGGTVYNGRRGTIEGIQNGVHIFNPYLEPLEPEVAQAASTAGFGGYYTVENHGSIYGDNGAGVLLQTKGGNPFTVYNGRCGYIWGWQNGVQVMGASANIDNYGEISSSVGPAILLDAYTNNIVTLENRSHVYGDIVGGGLDDAAFLYGRGEFDYSFTNFATLTVGSSYCRGGWNLTGINYFSTNATVNSDGMLRINGELNTPNTYVWGTLGGSGVINGQVDINEGGSLSPGNSPGTLTINGNLNFNEYSTYEVDARPTVADLTLVNGTTTIQTNSYVYVKLPFWCKPVYASNTVYTILTATNGVSGTFDTNVAFNVNNLFLNPATVWNDSTNVYLGLTRKSFTVAAGSGNQGAVAAALDSMVDSTNPAVAELIGDLFWLGTPEEVQAALDSLSGSLHGTMGLLDVQQQFAFNKSIAGRTGRLSIGQGGGNASAVSPILLASAAPTTLPPAQQAQSNNSLDIWLQGFGTFGNLKDDGTIIGGDYTISGVSGGLDYRLTPELLVGLGLGYSHNNADVGGPGSNAKVDAYQIAAYGGYVSGPWHLDGIFSYGFLQTDTKRIVSVFPIDQEVDGSYDGGVFAVSAEGGYSFLFDWLSVEPTVGFDYAHLSQNAFSETTIYGLNVNKVEMDSFQTALGVRLATTLGKKGDVQFIPSLRGVWKHEFSDRDATVNASFNGGSATFDAHGVKLGADSGVLTAGLTTVLNKSVSGFVNFDASMNAKLNSQSISGGLVFSW